MLSIQGRATETRPARAGSMRQDGSGAGASPPVAGRPSLASLIVSGDARLASAARPAGLRLAFDGSMFSVTVSADDGADLLSLGPYPESSVVAIWRSLAAASGLPLMVSGPDGTLHRPYPQLGRLVLGERTDRRRLQVLTGRRPRFLTRRKPGALPRRPLVFRERELAGGRPD